jgi:hypothetical protein
MLVVCWERDDSVEFHWSFAVPSIVSRRSLKVALLKCGPLLQTWRWTRIKVSSLMHETNLRRDGMSPSDPFRECNHCWMNASGRSAELRPERTGGSNLDRFVARQSTMTNN